MPQEIEAKFRLDDDRAVRDALARHGACPLGAVLETNTYFDDDAGSLRRGDRGLRIRVAQPIDPETRRFLPQPPKIVVTYKGPRRPGRMKVREEIEFLADDADAAADLLRALGLSSTMRFQKIRRSWRLDECRVELDELPVMGLYLEIEGPSESAVEAARSELGLAEAPMEPRPYLVLLCEHAAGPWAELLF